MSGEDRIAALQDEFPDQLKRDGNALLVQGVACQEGELIGRLLLPDTKVASL